MNKHTVLSLFILFMVFCVSAPARSDSAVIQAVNLTRTGANEWSLDVTLKHSDTGWDHYADNWRLVDDSGNLLAERLLMHPHVNEQPFTRSLSGVHIPGDVKIIYVEAHDSVHGWAEPAFKIDLSKAQNGHLSVRPD